MWFHILHQGEGQLVQVIMLILRYHAGYLVTDYQNSTGVFLKRLGAEVAMYRIGSDIFNLLDKVFGTHSQINQNYCDAVFLIEK
jgi:hypothetical protein